MCVSPYDMLFKFLAAQRQEVEAKFSLISGLIFTRDLGSMLHGLTHIIINNVTVTTISVSEQYVRCTAVCMFIMFGEYMFRYYLFSFILMFSTFSMFKLHVVIVGIVMLNILN
jgi:hypothetical protein